MFFLWNFSKYKKEILKNIKLLFRFVLVMKSKRLYQVHEKEKNLNKNYYLNNFVNMNHKIYQVQLINHHNFH
jgi:hypothetical protein